MALSKIVPRDENFANWYTSIVNNAKLVCYGDIKGTMIFQPNGWAIWNLIANGLDKEFKKINIKNVQLPTFIPYSQFAKEKEHIDGFAPEAFLVTKRGNENLDEPYVIRPTSEVLFCNYFKKILTSYTDLPIMYNQWCNVFRAEKTTRPFLRSSEFYWQELHSIHESSKEAKRMQKKMINIYKKFVNKFLCMPVLMGQKTIGERFAGAESTLTIEAFMQDGQMLQCGTSHNLSQNFAKTYEIKYQTKNNDYDYPYQVSAGVSTRLIGGMIMCHSDDHGLVLPPMIAPTQIAILPIFFDKNYDVKIVTNKIAKELKKYRIYVDWSDKGLGYKLSNQEILGTPLSIIIGPNDLKNDEIEIYRRDQQSKQKIKLKDVKIFINNVINDYSKSIFEKAKNYLNSHIVNVSTIDELKKCLENKKIGLAYWSGNANDEKKIKELTGATPRCIKEKNNGGFCILTGKKSKYLVYFARAY